MTHSIMNTKKWGGCIEFSDEVLCKNAQRGCIDCRHILWHRYENYIRQVVYNSNKGRYLPQQEIDDAIQESYFSFQTAVERYDPQHNGKSASFKTFLSLVVSSKFSSYCSQWRTYQRHLLPDSDDKAMEVFSTVDLDLYHISFSNWDEFVLLEVVSGRLASALVQLKPQEINLLQAWLEFGRDKEVASVLSISPAAAKLRRERLFRRIKRNVGGE